MTHHRRTAPSHGHRSGGHYETRPRNCGTELQEKVAFLSSAAAYGLEGQVETRETHMSWIFLTETLAYKLKKPVRFPHLDFSTSVRRRFFCEEELRLNRRLAAETYLDVLPLRRDREGAYALDDGRGRIVDWLVRMRRLPQEDMLDRRIETGALTRSDIEGIASALAAFYASLAPEKTGAEAYAMHLSREQAINREMLLRPRFGIGEQARGVVDKVDALMGEVMPLMKERVAAGAVVEGHGDLRPEHVCLSRPLQIIDCLEFNRTMRIVDPYDEVNYLGIECDMLGAGWIRPLLNAALPASGIEPPEPALLAFYAAFRCLLRARLSIAHLLERPIRKPAKWRPQALAYLRQAENELLSLQSP